MSRPPVVSAATHLEVCRLIGEGLSPGEAIRQVAERDGEKVATISQRYYTHERRVGIPPRRRATQNGATDDVGALLAGVERMVAELRELREFRDEVRRAAER